MRSLLPALFLLIPIAVSGPRSSAQPNPRLQTFFEQNIGLTQDQIVGLVVIDTKRMIALALVSLEKMQRLALKEQADPALAGVWFAKYCM